MKNWKTLFFLLLMVFVKRAEAVDAPFATQYGGEQIMTSHGVTRSTKVYVDDGKTRIEMETEEGKSVIIIRPDKKMVYHIIVASKIIMGSPISKEDQKMMASYDKSDRELLLTEKLKGVDHDKYKIVHEGNVLYMWVNKETNFPTQVESPDGTFRVEWKDVKLGPPDPSLFELPQGYNLMKTSENVHIEKP